MARSRWKVTMAGSLRRPARPCIPESAGGGGVTSITIGRRGAGFHGFRSSIFEVFAGQFDVQQLHRIHRFAAGRVGVELFGLLQALVAFQHDQAVGALDHRDRAAGVELQRLLEHLQPGGGVGALGLAEQLADLVDHLGVEGAQRDVRVGMLGRELDRGFERGLDLAAQALRQRLGHADALAVAAQGVGLPVIGVGVLRLFRLLGLGTLGDFQEHLQLHLLLLFEVVGVDGLGLVGHRDAGAAGGQARVVGGLELTGVEVDPGLHDVRVLRKRLGIPGMQPGPMLLQRRRRVDEGAVVVGKGGPLGHGLSPIGIDRRA
mmetsp:Transcript_26224/g.61939  ORF Transcript_26224/g.61939 Transcript_26224/m.61939 type:complete len:318 (+) Transcript_26224:613-1566(+)